jgi:DHA3 family macrolide efflux protein-like MFS transporter
VLNPLFMGMMVVAMSAAGWLKGMVSLPVMFGAAGALFLIGMFVLVPVLKEKLSAADPS